MINPLSRRRLLELTGVGVATLATGRPFKALAAADSDAASSSTFKLSEVAPGVFVHQGQHALFTPSNGGDISNCGAVVGKDAVAIIDTSGSAKLGQAFKDAIRRHTEVPIRYVINTHMHPDHVFGNAAFQSQGTTFLAHHKLARGLSARADRYLSVNQKSLGEAAFEGTRIVLPDNSVADTMALDLGGRTLILEAHKTAHTDNDLTVRDTATDTVFMGDLLFCDHTPALDGSIVGWIAWIEAMKKKPAARVVPGHGTAAMAWPQAIAPLEHYLKTLATEIRSQIKGGGTLREAMLTVGRSEKSAWELFEEYHVRNVSAAFAELEWE